MKQGLPVAVEISGFLQVVYPCPQLDLRQQVTQHFGIVVFNGVEKTISLINFSSDVLLYKGLMVFARCSLAVFIEHLKAFKLILLTGEHK